MCLTEDPRGWTCPSGLFRSSSSSFLQFWGRHQTVWRPSSYSPQGRVVVSLLVRVCVCACGRVCVCACVSRAGEGIKGRKQGISKGNWTPRRLVSVCASREQRRVWQMDTHGRRGKGEALPPLGRMGCRPPASLLSLAFLPTARSHGLRTRSRRAAFRFFSSGVGVTLSFSLHPMMTWF